MSVVLFFIVLFLNVSILISLNSSISNVSADTGLIATLGLIWGPFGSLTTAIINLLFDSLFVSPSLAIITFFINFLVGYLPFKLWYCFSKNDNMVSSPKLDSTYNLTKFVLIITLNSIIYTSLNFIVEYAIGNYLLINFIVDFLNVFIFSFIFGVIIITIFNTFNRNFYLPTNKFTVKTKYSNIAFVIGLFSLVILIILTFFNIGQINSILIFIPVFSFVIFSLREVPYEPVHFESVYTTIIEKIILIYLIISLVFVIIIAIATYDNILVHLKFIEAHLVMLVNLFFSILIAFIPALLILKYIENKFTTPITVFAKLTREYIENGDVGDIDYISNYANLIENNNEIGQIANSFSILIEKLEEYVDNLQKITKEKERIDAELNIATRIQESTLPKDFLISDKFEINAVMKPAREVGGDFYDFFMIDEDKLAIVIGDASGKGIPAAMFTVITKALIKNQLLSGSSLGEVFESVNNLLCENNEESMFVTVWAGIIELNSGKLTSVNAGHNSPIISKNNKFDYVKSNHGLVLGAMENMIYKENSVKLNHEEYVYLYTDGITEAHNSNDELFGEDRLLEVLNKYEFNTENVISIVDGEVEKFVGEREQFDDMTMLIFKIKNNSK